MGFWRDLFNFLGSPMSDNPEVHKAYWEGISSRDKANTPEIHKHVHLHSENEEFIESYDSKGGLYLEKKL